MNILLGDICYPKSKAIIIPANSLGIMSNHVQRNIIKDGLSSITKEIKKIITNNIIKIGESFVTGPGRLKRRGLEKIYHVVIKKSEGDFTSLFIVENALNVVFKKIIKDKVESVAMCGIGTGSGDLDRKSMARIIVGICNKFDKKIKIKIIDKNEEFITECINFAKDMKIYEKE